MKNTQCLFEGKSHLEKLFISSRFAVIHTPNRNKFILPEDLVIIEMYDNNPLPIQSVNFSAVKRILFSSQDHLKGSGAVVSDEFICHVFRSSENLENVTFGKGFYDFMTNTSNLAVIPSQRKLKFLSIKVFDQDQSLSQLILVISAFADHVNL